VFNFQTSGEAKGNIRESGLKFYLPDWAGELRWKRNAYWTWYNDNFAGGEGAVSLCKTKKPPYGEKPETTWSGDAYNYFYWADAGANCENPLSNAAKAMKENIWYYQLFPKAKDTPGLAVISTDASLACRLNRRPDGGLVLYVNTRWDYPELSYGNYSKNLPSSPNAGTLALILAPK
jgi:hypothetical protein